MEREEEFGGENAGELSAHRQHGNGHGFALATRV